MPDVREVYEMVTKQKPPEPGALERQQKRQVRAARNKRVGAYVVAAAIVLAAAVPILVTSSGEDATTPADEATGNTQAEEIATGFVEAYGGSFDADRAITYLADDADISGLMLGPERVEGTRAELRLNLAMLEAQRHVQELDPCEVTGSLSSGTERVRCAFDFHLLGSDEIGLGPYGGSRYDLSVLDGEIVRASVYWEIAEFSPQMWEPFADWVSTTHPDDAAVMYTDATYSIPHSARSRSGSGSGTPGSTWRWCSPTRWGSPSASWGSQRLRLRDGDVARVRRRGESGPAEQQPDGPEHAVRAVEPR